MGIKVDFFLGDKFESCGQIPLETVHDLKNKFENCIQNPKTQFFYAPERTHLIDQSKKVFTEFENKKCFVQVGIGGSSLGPEMLVSALKNNQRKFLFINNIDPDYLKLQLEQIELNETLFYFVSKSGSTAETMAALAIIAHHFESHGLTKENFKNYFVFATDPIKSELKDLATQFSIKTLEVPSDVGGRFSVLTPVGYLPALFAGIEIDELAKGANEFKHELMKSEWFYRMGYTCHELSKKQITQTVFLPYSSRLKDFSFWFTQLWAESLGKKQDRSGKVVHQGLTPIPAYGATDQHSQMQLFMEGPFDKLILLLEVEKFSHDYALKNQFQTSSLKKLAGHSLAQLMKAELEGTLKALKEGQRPLIKLSMAENNPYHMGALIILFECLTALVGEIMNIDAFNQPGVEAGKIYAFEFLGLKS